MYVQKDMYDALLFFRNASLLNFLRAFVKNVLHIYAAYAIKIYIVQTQIVCDILYNIIKSMMRKVFVHCLRLISYLNVFTG